MKNILITQKLIRDKHLTLGHFLDSNWLKLMHAFNLIPIIIPNNLKLCKHIMESNQFSGAILTGGNDIGDFPERDEVEMHILNDCIDKNIPLLGVCRGMQIIQKLYGSDLVEVKGHVNKAAKVLFNDHIYNVNSFHNYGSYNQENKKLITIATDVKDNLIKAIKVDDRNIFGIMWHPERKNVDPMLNEYFIGRLFE